MVRVRMSRIGLACTAAALAAAVTACGGGANDAQPQPSSSATTTESGTPASPSSSASPGGPQATTAPAAQPDNGVCKAADLKLSLGRGEGAAGTVYRPLVFTNVSDHSCVIQGFPGVSYVAGADGHQVGAAAYRDGSKGAPVTLAKGASAYADVGFVNVQNYDPVTCQPQPVRGLRVYPPQETASLFVEMSGTGCANEKIPGNQLTVKTIQAGTGPQ